MIKVDSDEETEDSASAPMEGGTSARPAENFNDLGRDNASTRAKENASGWPLESAPMSPTNEQSQSLGWNTSSVILSSANVDKDEVPDAWDETVYPHISSFGDTIDSASEVKLNPADCVDRAAIQNDRWPDQVSEKKPIYVPEGWFNLAGEASKSSREEKGQGKAQAQGLTPRHTTSAQPAPTRGRGRGRGSIGHPPQTSTQQNRGRSGNRSGRTSRGSGLASNARRAGKVDQPGRGANRFGALAADALVDLVESEDVDPESIPVPLALITVVTPSQKTSRLPVHRLRQ